MRIKAKRIEAKTEYSRKRNKCPCCTRINCREELLRKIECREAEQEFNGEAVVTG